MASKYQSLNKGRLRTYNLKTALKHIVRVMRIFMRIYYVLSYALPLLVFGGAWYGLKFEMESSGGSLAEIPAERWAGLWYHHASFWPDFYPGCPLVCPLAVWQALQGAEKLPGRIGRELKMENGE